MRLHSACISLGPVGRFQHTARAIESYEYDNNSHVESLKCTGLRRSERFLHQGVNRSLRQLINDKY